MLGKGKYQSLHGVENRFDILLNHLQKVAGIAKRHGFDCIMWGDMFFRILGGDYGTNDTVKLSDDVKGLIPDNVNLIYWDYYSTDKNNYDRRIKSHSAIKDGIWFAGGLWSWTGFAPHNDYSIEAAKVALESCAEHGINNVIRR